MSVGRFIRNCIYIIIGGVVLLAFLAFIFIPSVMM